MKLTRKQMKEDKMWLKYNAMDLAKEHRKHCKNPDCGISLIRLGLLVEMAGIKITKNQWKEFL